MNNWKSKQMQRLENVCSKIANTEHIDNDLNTSATLFAMTLLGYVMIPEDPINDPDGEEKLKWVNIRQNTAKAVHDLLSYYGDLHYDEQVDIRDRLMDFVGDDTDFITLSDEIIHEYGRFEREL